MMTLPNWGNGGKRGIILSYVVAFETSVGYKRLCLQKGKRKGSWALYYMLEPTILETEVGGFQVQGQPELYNEYETNLGHIVRTCPPPQEEYVLALLNGITD